MNKKSPRVSPPSGRKKNGNKTQPLIPPLSLKPASLASRMNPFEAIKRYAKSTPDLLSSSRPLASSRMEDERVSDIVISARSESKDKQKFLSHFYKKIVSKVQVTPREGPKESGRDVHNTSVSETISDTSVARRLEDESSEGDEDDDEDTSHCSSTNSDASNYRDSQVGVLNIEWSEIQLPRVDSSRDLILGKGSFGTVIRAIWTKDGIKKEVAIKVQTQVFRTKKDKREFEKVRKRAGREAFMMMVARSKLDSTLITDVYGIIDGPIPINIASVLKKKPLESAIGIVMQFQGGGSLDTLILGSKSKVKSILPMCDKVRLLSDVAKAIEDLHSVGIIHADIKAANVLLSNDSPPQVRLADFGMSIIRKQPTRSRRSIKASLVEKTNKNRGTRAFCAPEMLVNPYTMEAQRNSQTGQAYTKMLSEVAMPSRSTDQYAFSLLCWQVLAQKRPFSEIRQESELCARVHMGERPNLELLPGNTPTVIVDMIKQCWSGERELRLSAAECREILEKVLPTLPVDVPILPSLTSRSGYAGSSSGSTEEVETARKSLSRESVHRLVAEMFHLDLSKLSPRPAPRVSWKPTAVPEPNSEAGNMFDIYQCASPKVRSRGNSRSSGNKAVLKPGSVRSSESTEKPSSRTSTQSASPGHSPHQLKSSTENRKHSVESKLTSSLMGTSLRNS